MIILVRGSIVTEFYCESDYKYIYKELEKHEYGILDYSKCTVDIETYTEGDVLVAVAHIDGKIELDTENDDEALAIMEDYAYNGKFGDLENVEWDFVE